MNRKHKKVKKATFRQLNTTDSYVIDAILRNY